MTLPASTVGARIKYPPGFRPRRGLNWFILGLMYASYYMCRYNFRFAAPGMVQEFHFNTFQITSILSAWSVAYGIGQLLNGLLTDRIGGRAAMLIGAAGTISLNFIYGFASFTGTFSTFALIWLVNGYFQSFGAPGMIKINAAWFNRTERGTFAGIFGFMIQSGQFAINNLAPFLLAGFAIGTWTIGQDEWRWLFRLPPLVTAFMAVLVVLIPKETPEQAGYPGLIHDELSAGDTGVRSSIREMFCHHFYASAGVVLCRGICLHRRGAQQLRPARRALFRATTQARRCQERRRSLDDESDAACGGLRFAGFRNHFGQIFQGPPCAGGDGPVFSAVTRSCSSRPVSFAPGLSGRRRLGIFLGCLFLVLISLTRQFHALAARHRRGDGHRRAQNGRLRFGRD